MKKIVLLVAIAGLTQNLFSGVLDDYSRACSEGDINGCYQLAIAYRDGDGVERDDVAAKQFFEIACESGNTRACSELNTKEKKHNNLNINTLETKDGRLLKYKKACDNGDGSACYELGILYDHGKVIEKNNEKANQFYLRACELKDDDGCAAMALFYEMNHNMKKAIYYYDKVCENSGKMCEYIALYYESGGDGLDKDLEKAKEYYERACDHGKKDSCHEAEVISYILDFTLSQSSPNQADNHMEKAKVLMQYTNERFGFTLAYPASLCNKKSFRQWRWDYTLQCGSKP